MYKYDEEIDAINIKWYSAADDIDIESYRIEIKSNSCDEDSHPCWFEAHEDCDGSLPEVMDAKQCTIPADILLVAPFYLERKWSPVKIRLTTTHLTGGVEPSVFSK